MNTAHASGRPPESNVSFFVAAGAVARRTQRTSSITDLNSDDAFPAALDAFAARMVIDYV